MALHRLTKLMVCLLATTALLSAGGAAGKAGPRQASPEHAGGNGTGALPPLPPAEAPLLRALVLPEVQDQESQGTGPLPPLPPPGAPLPRTRGTGALPPLPPAGAAAPLPRARGAVARPQVQGQESHGTGAGPLLPPAATPLPHASVETIPPLQSDPAASMKITYEVTRTKYMAFQRNLFSMLTSSGREVETVPLLAPQTGPTKLPPAWILITIEGTKPKEAVVLAVRTDNVYIVGFKNMAGIWFSFPDYKHLIKGSTPLSKTHDYDSLVGGHGKLKELDINRDAVAQDVRFLSTFRPPPRPNPTYEATLGISLPRLCLVVAEAARFKTINATVVAAMDEQGPSRITLQQTKLIVVWGITSKALFEYKKEGWKPDKSEKVAEAGIHGAQDAINALKTMLEPMGAKLEAEEGNVELED